MKKFIEVTAGNGKHLINVDSISHIREKRGGRCEITLLSSDENSNSYCLSVQETYEQIAEMLSKPGNPSALV